MKYCTRHQGGERQIACVEWTGWLTVAQLSVIYGMPPNAIQRRIRSGKPMSDPLRVTKGMPGYRRPRVSELAKQARAANPFAVLVWQ